jgi:hypothetical protein
MTCPDLVIYLSQAMTSRHSEISGDNSTYFRAQFDILIIAIAPECSASRPSRTPQIANDVAMTSLNFVFNLA